MIRNKFASVFFYKMSHVVTADAITSAVMKLIEHLPFLDFLLSKCDAYLFGGFLRWVAEFIGDNRRDPTKEELYEYLKTGDVDIKVRRGYFDGEITRFSIRDFFDLIPEINGYIEFAGNDYSSYVIDSYTIKEFSPKDSLYYGQYFVWIPVSEDQFIRYEIIYLAEAAVSYIYEDFSVNVMRFWYSDVKSFLDTTKEVLDDIANRNLRPCFMYSHGMHNLKRIYRMVKLWKRGYCPSNKGEFGEVIKSTIEGLVKGETTEFNTHICVSDLNKPSMIDGKRDKIRVTKHKYENMTLERFKNDPIVKEICKYVGIEI